MVVARVVILLLAIGLVGLVAFSSKDTAPRTSPSPSYDDRRLSQTACKEYVKRALHDPDSAEFDDTSSFYATDAGDVWTVLVTGRARNGFNAMRRMEVKCDVRHAGGQWTIVSLDQLPQ